MRAVRMAVLAGRTLVSLVVPGECPPEGSAAMLAWTLFLVDPYMQTRLNLSPLVCVTKSSSSGLGVAFSVKHKRILEYRF